MPTDVVMPQMGESITEGTITKWLKKPGDTVHRDEPLFEISTDKVDAEIPSPAAGTLGEIKIQKARPSRSTPSSAPSTKLAPQLLPPLPRKQETAAARRRHCHSRRRRTPAATQGIPRATSRAGRGPGTEVMMPQMGESITEGTITKWLKKVGDTVQRDEPIFEISTDKVDAEIPSPVAGTLTEIKVHEGKTVTINTVVAVIGGAAGTAARRTAAASLPRSSAAPAPAAAPAAAAPAAAEGHPAPRRWSARSPKTTTSISRRSPAPAPPAASPRATSSATSRAAQAAAAAPAAAAPAPAAAKPAAPQPQPGELVPMTKMRAIIAKRMVESKAPALMSTPSSRWI